MLYYLDLTNFMRELLAYLQYYLYFRRTKCNVDLYFHIKTESKHLVKQ